MLRLGIKDLIRGKVYIFSVLLLNLGYIGIHFLPNNVRDDYLYGYEVAYILIISILIPMILSLRYSDANRKIIKNVIEPKINKIDTYQGLFLLVVLGTMLMVLFVSILVLAIFTDMEIVRYCLFWLHIMIVGFLLIMLFTSLVSLFNQFSLGWVSYCVIIFGIILWNAPASYLWFIYTEDYPVKDHWAGKIILAVFISFFHMLIKLCGGKFRKFVGIS